MTVLLRLLPVYAVPVLLQFTAATGIAAISTIALIVVVRGRRRESGALAGVDLWRGGLFTPAITLVLVAMEKIGTWGWGDRRVSGELASGLALLAYWARDQFRERAPLIDVRLLLQPRIAIANLTMIGVAPGSVDPTRRWVCSCYRSIGLP